MPWFVLGENPIRVESRGCTHKAGQLADPVEVSALVERGPLDVSLDRFRVAERRTKQKSNFVRFRP